MTLKTYRKQVANILMGKYGKSKDEAEKLVKLLKGRNDSMMPADFSASVLHFEEV